MANEAVIIELGSDGGRPVRRTCADATAITKGALLKLSGANIAIAPNTAGSGDAFAGIAAHDKVANDGSTTISCYTEGVFDILNSTVVLTTGAQVVMSGANIIRAAVAGDLLTGAVIGTAEEPAAASEVIRVRLKGF